MLTFALDAVLDHLSALRLQPPAKDVVQAPTREPAQLTPEDPEGAFYVLDTDL